MRPVMNRYERATLQREIANCKHEMFCTEVAFIVNQPSELAFGWMNEIASDREEIQRVDATGVRVKVGIIRPMTEHMHAEPSFGRVCVISVPDLGPGHAHEVKAIVEQRLVWQRFEDFYGKNLARGIVNVTNNPKFFQVDSALMVTDDLDTSFIIVVREPKVEISRDPQALALQADTTMSAVFNTLQLLESKSGELEMKAQERLPFEPRLLDVRNTDGNGNVEQIQARGYGMEVEMVLNGVSGDHLIDKTYMAAFWRHFVKFCDTRPKDPKTLAGIYTPEAPVPQPDPALLQKAQEIAANDNLNVALGS
jgi:hypothetical protein